MCNILETLLPRVPCHQCLLVFLLLWVFHFSLLHSPLSSIYPLNMVSWSCFLLYIFSPNPMSSFAPYSIFHGPQIFISSLDLYVKLRLDISTGPSYTCIDYKKKEDQEKSPGKQQYLNDIWREKNAELAQRRIMKPRSEACPGSQSKTGFLNE